MTNDKVPESQITAREQESLVRTMLRRGIGRSDLCKEISELNDTFKKLTKEASDCLISEEQLLKDHKGQTPIPGRNPEWLAQLEGLVNKTGISERLYVVRKEAAFLLKLHHETALEAHYRAQASYAIPFKKGSDEIGKKWIADTNKWIAKTKAQKACDKPAWQSKEAYKPSIAQIDEVVKKGDPYYERVPALIAQLTKFSASFANNSGQDLYGFNYINRTVICVLERALAARDLQIAKPVSVSLKYLANMAEKGQEELERYADAGQVVLKNEGKNNNASDTELGDNLSGTPLIEGKSRAEELTKLRNQTERTMVTKLFEGPKSVKALALEVGISVKTAGIILKELKNRRVVWRKYDQSPYCLGWPWRAK